MNNQFDGRPKSTSGNTPESEPAAEIYDIDLSKGFDTEAQLKILKRKLRSLRFYRPGLLYSGFNADHIGESSSSKEPDGSIFCAKEKDMFDYSNADFESNSPFAYASEYKTPAIAIYDPSKMEPASGLSYKPRSPDALIAIVRLKF